VTKFISASVSLWSQSVVLLRSNFNVQNNSLWLVQKFSHTYVAQESETGMYDQGVTKEIPKCDQRVTTVEPKSDHRGAKL
jgi:hypothetical protein